MTAPTNATAVIRTTPRDVTAQEHTQKAQAAASRARLISRAAQAIRAQTWGTKLNDATARALAWWCYQNDVDAVTEVDILGGRVYLNSQYYGRILSRLIEEGRIENYRRVWIHADERLTADMQKGGPAAAWAAQELDARRRLRIEHNVPEEADAAALVLIKVREVADELPGVKFHVEGRTKTVKVWGQNGPTGQTKEVAFDPVGDEYAMETIETRAMRRAMLMVQRRTKLAMLAPDEVPLLDLPDTEPVEPMTGQVNFNPNNVQMPTSIPTPSARTRASVTAGAASEIPTRSPEPSAPEREPGEEDEDLEDERWIVEQDRARGQNV